jgi:NADH-quinone oxidoreductase subunit L
MELIISLIPLFPLLGFLILGLGFNRVPAKVASVVGPGTVLLSFAGSLIVFFHLLFGHGTCDSGRIVTNLFNWISFHGFTVSFSFLIDPLSVLMLLVITGVGFLIHLYSVGYMKGDPGYNRFFAYMNLFVFFMLLLVMGAGYVIMFIGWEGVGLCSYLLIGFWFKNQEFNNAAKKAFIMNRIGDLGFLLGIFLLFTTFGSVNYLDIFGQVKVLNPGTGLLTIITLLLFTGAVGKSAQIPLFTWLPDAMAGPTPVSALIHAATMVTAGVYMVARSNLLFALAPATMTVVAVTGLATVLFAASIAIFQNDIKKILAYSTISQLGYMFIALGMGAFTGAMFHLATHAFFKALLFLAAGSVIHALGGEQDIRKMGGLGPSINKTRWVFLIGTIAISGIPPFSGFFSKDEILSHLFNRNTTLYFLALAGAIMTSLYMFRLYYLTFHGRFKGTAEQKHHLHESPSVMLVPLFILAGLSIAGGVINLPVFMRGTAWLQSFLAPVFSDAIPHLKPPEFEHEPGLEWLLVGISVVCVGCVVPVAYLWYVLSQEEERREPSWLSFLRKIPTNKYYIDELYDALVVRPVMSLSKGFHETIEKKIIDRVVDGAGALVVRAGNTIRYLQTGHVGFYVFIMVAGIIAVLIFNMIL